MFDDLHKKFFVEVETTMCLITINIFYIGSPIIKSQRQAARSLLFGSQLSTESEDELDDDITQISDASEIFTPKSKRESTSPRPECSKRPKMDEGENSSSRGSVLTV